MFHKLIKVDFIKISKNIYIFCKYRHISSIMSKMKEIDICFGHIMRREKLELVRIVMKMNVERKRKRPKKIVYIQLRVV